MMPCRPPLPLLLRAPAATSLPALLLPLPLTRARADATSSSVSTPPLSENSRCGKSRFSAHTHSYRSGGTVRFWCGFRPLSKHLRAWMTKWETPDPFDTTSTKLTSCG